jgi:hypothetical protein
MKLFICPKCEQMVDLMSWKKYRKGKYKNKGIVTRCYCGKSAGKYLSDNCTAVFTKDCPIVGIDNNTFMTAVARYFEGKILYDSRVDFFFTGWIPTIPGEVIFVDTVQDVIDYPFKVEVPVTSTMPVSV